MANWGTMDVAFYSNNKEQLESLRETLKCLLEPSENGLHKGLYDLFTESEAENLHLRGYLSVLGDIALNNDIIDEYYLIASFECAWTPCSEAITLLLSKKFPEVHYVYTFVEQGCELYINTDVQGKYFPFNYYLDWCEAYQCPKSLSDKNNYQTEQEVLDTLNKFFGTHKNDINYFLNLSDKKLAQYGLESIWVHDYTYIDDNDYYL